MSTVYLDRALAYDPVTRRCDRVFGGVDCAIDATPVTALLMAVGLERRAHPDDVLPEAMADPYEPSRLDPMRGWCGDFLHPRGLLTGSRMWLLFRRKQDEATRLLAETALKEPLDVLGALRGWSIQIVVRWVRWQVLGYQATVGQTTLAPNVPVG
jgi:phage gp46-like protein